MSANPSAVFGFREFRLDSGNHLLTRSGQPVTLPPKAFQLLLLLVQNAGRLVTKDDLIDQLWSDVVVQENNLTQHISLLRKNLGPDLRIETVPRLGYRFLEEVTEEREVTGERKAHEPRATHAEPVSAQRRNTVIGAAVAGIVLLALGATLIGSRRFETGPSEIRSIAVLPLRPIGALGDASYMNLGIADAVISHLSSLRAIDVRPTSSIRRYASGAYDTRRAARELVVDAILEGTIQRFEERVRVRVQLVDVRRNVPIFSGKFDESASDPFALEDAVAGAIARALALETPAADAHQAGKLRSLKPGAYEAYLKGRVEWSHRTPDSVKASIRHYEDAINRDASYAAAYAGMSESLNLLSLHGLDDPARSFGMAKDAAGKALAIDNSLADAHAALGTALFFYDWDWPGAEHRYREALRLDPKHGHARQLLSNLFMTTGHFEEGLKLIAEAMRRDPTSLMISNVACRQFYLVRRYDAAIQQCRRTLDRDTSFSPAYKNLTFALVEQGRFDEALASIERHRELSGTDGFGLSDLAFTLASHPGRRQEAAKMEPQLLEQHSQGKISPYELAVYYAALGDRAEALRRLDEAMARRYSGMVWLAVDPRLDALRSEPRFRDLLRTMKLDHGIRGQSL